MPTGRWRNETETVATSKQKHCPSLQASIFPNYKGSKVNPARYKPWLKVTARILTTHDHAAFELIQNLNLKMLDLEKPRLDAAFVIFRQGSSVEGTLGKLKGTPQFFKSLRYIVYTASKASPTTNQEITV